MTKSDLWIFLQFWCPSCDAQCNELCTFTAGPASTRCHPARYARAAGLSREVFELYEKADWYRWIHSEEVYLQPGQEAAAIRAMRRELHRRNSIYKALHNEPD